jgi:photosystem II stability/assembly factor-like uncharacterized protein
MKKYISLITILLISSIGLFGQKKSKSDNDVKSKKDLPDAMFSGFKFRSIGPAVKSGRIADLAVNPNNYSEYYVAVASGGVWKTTNAGTSYQPIFDGQGSYSIGCVKIDPNNSNVVWVGTGENNNQRSVAYGDGVYKSLDGGKSWKNMGLKSSEHIGNMIIHPDNSDIIFVAAYGPLWNEGGERGVYKSTDGGKTWKQVLFVSENTGFADIIMDPRNPDVLYAAAHQRRRHVFTYIGGGPESGIYKSTDGGGKWEKINKGLPEVDMGRIGLAISLADPEYIYAIVEAADEKGGFFVSTNRGASWQKQSKWTTSGNYYQEIVCDPKDPLKVFSLNTWLQHTEDGGKTFKKTGEKFKHVDNHAMWIEPGNTNHWIVGCDGGIYETWDGAANWQFKPNLPLTQFYKVSVDNDEPFYNVYGGTQDNNTQGGPSRTLNNAGILNSDWFITNGGDGFEAQIDPTNPNIVYAQSQYGFLMRFDKKSGERVSIQPFPKKGGDALRWNWDAPLIISPHDHTTLYFAAQKLFKSTDRGDSWTVISPDLTHEFDRNELEVMGKVWSIDAVMKNRSTTIYGNIVALDESPITQGLLYVGTDDGLIQISEDDGANWNRIDRFEGIPDMTYVNMLLASQHDQNVVYAVFNDHKRGNFKPYLYRSSDKGNTWHPIQGDLPERGSVYSIAEDHVNPNLLFAGTEFGVFVSLNGGKHWHQLKSGLPTIAVRDMAIQKRENDLVLGTFGRSFYVLDDYSPLREMAKSEFDKTRTQIFPVKTALLYIQSNPMGLTGKADQGEMLYAAANPPFGVKFYYNFADTLKTAKETRQAKEKKEKNNYYPSFDALKNEKQEEKPFLLFLVRDANGNIVKKLRKPASAEMSTTVWDLRHATAAPTRLKPQTIGRYGDADSGPLAMPGTYSVEIVLVNNGEFNQVAGAVNFEVKLLENRTIQADDMAALLKFQEEIEELGRRVSGVQKQISETSNKLKFIKKAIEEYPNAKLDWLQRVLDMEYALYNIKVAFFGDPIRQTHQFEVYPGISYRLGIAAYSTWNSFATPTKTAEMNLSIAREDYGTEIVKLQTILQNMALLEKEFSDAKMPYTPGRGSEWKRD